MESRQNPVKSLIEQGYRRVAELKEEKRKRKSEEERNVRKSEEELQDIRYGKIYSEQGVHFTPYSRYEGDSKEEKEEKVFENTAPSEIALTAAGLAAGSVGIMTALAAPHVATAALLGNYTMTASNYGDLEPVSVASSAVMDVGNQIIDYSTHTLGNIRSIPNVNIIDRPLDEIMTRLYPPAVFTETENAVYPPAGTESAVSGISKQFKKAALAGGGILLGIGGNQLYNLYNAPTSTYYAPPTQEQNTNKQVQDFDLVVGRPRHSKHKEENMLRSRSRSRRR